jgi:hypothetical protein
MKRTPCLGKAAGQQTFATEIRGGLRVHPVPGQRRPGFIVQQVFHSAAVYNHGIRLDRLGDWRIAESRTQGHRDKLTPRQQTDKPPEESIGPGILEGETVVGELDPPTEMLTIAPSWPV